MRVDVAARIRVYLLVTLIFGLLGMGTELLLIGHFETVQQRIPLMLLGIGLAAACWHARAPTRRTIAVLRTVMTLCVVSGIVGIWLHYQGNEEFELEMYPAMQGFELVRKVLTGATPVLAPGSMALLGLVGLTLVYRHPVVHGGAAAPPTQEGDI
ncbi:MAG: hypothetical protein HOP16_04085 [Acidobacteria bacterium]|nr:hypothetical protein [Acidobacteriota bacterium]